ncbi:MAG: hypothetical protein AAF907_02140 [Planctomycetota bacterium]
MSVRFATPPPDVRGRGGLLDEPLRPGDLSVLRRQVATVRAASQRAGTFRGFRSMTVGFSAVAALATGCLAGSTTTEATAAISVRYDVATWVTVAAVCLGAAAGEMLWRAKGSPYGLAMLWTAAGQFLPCVAAGGLVTETARRFRPDLLPSLPGIWALLFGLGVCSCARLLPRAFWGVGLWYLAAGCVGLAAPDMGASNAFLAVAFGVGQGASALLLYLLVERPERLAGRREGWGEDDPPHDSL